MTPWAAENGREGPEPTDQRLRPKKLPCGHILHFACLRSWLERQQICPTCRQPVLGGQTPGREAQQNREPADGPRRAQAAGEAAQPRAQEQRPGAPNGQAARPPRANNWRRFQLGPLALEMGHWRGQVPPAAANPVEQAARAQPGPRIALPGVASGPRVQRTALGPTTAESSTMQMQIDMIEHQILQQINSLRLTVGHLSRVRASQEELIRLHGLQHGGAPPSVQVFRSDSSRSALQAGSDALPPGLTLPEGWSLMPLSRSGGSPSQTAGPNAGDGMAGDGRNGGSAAVQQSSIPASGSQASTAEGGSSSGQPLQESHRESVQTGVSAAARDSLPTESGDEAREGLATASDPAMDRAVPDAQGEEGMGAVPHWGSNHQPQIATSDDEEEEDSSSEASAAASS